MQNAMQQMEDDHEEEHNNFVKFNALQQQRIDNLATLAGLYGAPAQDILAIRSSKLVTRNRKATSLPNPSVLKNT